jgi:hypothetical protein
MSWPNAHRYALVGTGTCAYKAAVANNVPKKVLLLFRIILGNWVSDVIKIQNTYACTHNIETLSL